jgi:multidrug efflux pump subunit AcrA (membrane-fusion protein)
VAGADHRIRFTQVQVGRDYGLQVEISNGLRPGDLVVVSPSDEIREGVEVKPVPFKSPDSSPPSAAKRTAG